MTESQVQFIPTIDIYDGDAVLVLNGKVVTKIGDPLKLAEFLSINNVFQVTDLSRAINLRNGKEGEGEKEDANDRSRVNVEMIKKICKDYTCYVSGGIRTYEDACELLNAGAKRVGISTSAHPDLLSKLDRNRTIVAFDIDHGGNILIKGRLEKLSETLFQRLAKVHQWIDLLTITFHDTEGTGLGIPMDRVLFIKKHIGEHYGNIKLTVAGGINSTSQISALIAEGINPQFGFGLWKGLFSLSDVFCCMLNSKKQSKWTTTNIATANTVASPSTSTGVDPLYPCIVMKDTSRTLGLVYVNGASLRASVENKVATFYSRDHGALWVKGETSGNKFKVKKIIFSCDRTSLLMVVTGNVFCHTGYESCFNFRDPAASDLREFTDYLQKKGAMVANNSSNSANNSYTQKLLASPTLIRYKLTEELQELINASPENFSNEMADVLYFLMLYLIQNKEGVGNVLDELTRRRFKVETEKFKTVNKPECSIIGVCFLKGNIKANDKFFEFLEDIGIIVEGKDRDIKKMILPCKSLRDPSRKIIIQVINPKDVFNTMHNGMIDAVLCYDDIIRNNPVDVFKKDMKKEYHATRIVVASRNDFDFEGLKLDKGYKFTIVSEYKRITEEWIGKNKLTAKVIALSGSAEGYLLTGVADMCVCVCDSGATIKANNLKIIAELGLHSIGFYVRRDRVDAINSLLAI